MARNKIKPAGGPYIRMKSLAGVDALENREIVLTTDTHELFAGTGNGDFALLGNAIIGTKSRLATTDPIEGRFFCDYERGTLYIGTGVGWKRCGVMVGNKSGLVLDEITGELRISTDNKTIIVNDHNELESNSIDYGYF